MAALGVPRGVPSPSTRTTVDAGSGPLSMWSTLRLNDMDKGSGSASARPGSAAAFGGIPEPEIPAGGAALVYAAMAGRGGHAPTGAAGATRNDHDGRATAASRCLHRVLR